MKIQSLAIMFIILILPISLVLSSYTQNRVETLSLQARYDSRLNSATYDALKAYQLNSFNSDSGSFVNSKIRDIKASSNAFFTALASNFSTVGYTKETLQNYVPALVYTMYDGYYMYSPYTNTLDEETKTRYNINGDNSLYGLKPYVYYSCRYVGRSSSKGNYDVVITYSLDNYINIQGVVKNNEVISKYGYLLSDVKETSDGKALYKNIQIEPEKILTEYVSFDGNVKECRYIKINGTKYYLDSSNIFSVNNGKSNIKYDLEFPDKDSNAVNYYRDSIKMIEFIQDSGLDEITVDQAVDSQGYPFNDSNSPFTGDNNTPIFDFDHNNGIEAKDSNFNVHRQDVIKYAITKNLSVAISNYNNYSGVSGVDFQMPMLKDTDWDKIMDNISIISFLQGMNIGGKIYNGYSVITNTKNEDVVTDDSIYIRTGTSVDDYQFHRINEIGLENNMNNAVGIFNIDVERRTGEDTNGNSIYYYPKYGMLSYDSIITQNKVKDKSEVKPNLLKTYYTALGRERYSMYREKLEF